MLLFAKFLQNFIILFFFVSHFQTTKAVPMRILFEIQQEQGRLGSASGEMHLATPARHRNLSSQRNFRIRSGRQREQIVLSESMFVGQTVSRP